MAPLLTIKDMKDAVRDGNADAYFAALEAEVDPHEAQPPFDLLSVLCQNAHPFVPKAGQSNVVQPQHLEILEHLIGHVGLVPTSNHQGLLFAAQNGHLDLIQALIKFGFDPHAFNDRALTLAAEKNHLPCVRFLLDQGLSLDAGKGSARSALTDVLMANIKKQAVLPDDAVILRRLWHEAETFGVSLDAPQILADVALHAASIRGIVATEQHFQDHEKKILEVVNTVIELGTWTDRQPNDGIHGPLIHHLAAGGLNTLIDRFVELGADPRAADDALLWIAARKKHYHTVDHLIERYGADLNAQDARARTMLQKGIQSRVEDAAVKGDTASIVADRQRAQGWGFDLSFDTPFHKTARSTDPKVQACALWLVDQGVAKTMVEDALIDGLADGDVVRSQRWLDKLREDGEPWRTVNQESAMVVVARKNRIPMIEWLVSQGVDLVVHGTYALNDINGNSKNAPTAQWLAHHIEQETLRRSINEVVAETPAPIVPRRRL